MKLEGHPEYIQSLRDRETVARCRRAIEEWRAEGLALEAPAYDLSWTPASALGLVDELRALFHAYNAVLWEQYPYCRACGGQCCVNEASHVGWFDGVAIALLGASLPDLPANLAATDRACIYLAGQACSLPAEWRTIKCWSFFCLGGLWARSTTWSDAVPLGERYHDLTAALRATLHEHLPGALRRYERVHGDPLIDHLHDPADFAAALEDALWEVLIGPLHARYPLHDESEPEPLSAEADPDARAQEVLTFISEAMELVLVDPPPVPAELQTTVAQLLEDLELFEWIVVGQPAHGTRLLREIASRYAAAPGPIDGEQPSVWYRTQMHIAQLLR